MHRRLTIFATATMLTAALTACGGGGASSITDLAQVRSKLVDAGMTCPKPPQPYKKSDTDISLGADPIKELDCSTGGVDITVSQWKDAASAKAMMAVAMQFVCGFGADSFSMVEGGNWVLVADASAVSDEADAKTSKENAAAAKAGKALGIDPTVHKCDKSSNDDDAASDNTDDQASDTTERATTTVASEGDRSKPLAVGKGTRVGDYDVTITSIIPDATAQVQGANEFNDPPTKGQYAQVTFEATYQGDEEGTPSMDLSVVLSGADKVQYPASDCMATLDTDYATIEPGGKVSVTSCIDAPAAAFAGGRIFIESSFSFGDEERAYWAIP